MKTPNINGFDQFTLSPEVLKAILELGYETPSPIQQETIPILLKQHTDFLGLAATGTGKTAAFGIPLLENLDGNVKGVQALILCPTRELAKQVGEQLNLLGRFKKTKALAIYGGSDYGGQLRALKEGVSIVVGTPGRIIDHLDRGTLQLSSLSTVVLDEADEMISMGFRDAIESILERVTEKKKLQTWLFSATMSRDVRKIADRFLKDPKQIQINKKESITTAVQQFFYQVHEDEKPEIIGRLMDQVPNFYGLIFCQTKMLVISLTQTLKNHGYSVDCLHGDMEQNARERTMKAFKARQCTVLVCTDVASRGIDVKDLTHVINYSLPRELDLYVHRIGRTGRGGKEGIALSLVTPSHMGLVRRIEQTTQSHMTKLTVPQESDVLVIKAEKAMKELMELSESDTARLEDLEKLVHKSELKTALGQMSREELMARYLAKALKVKVKSTESSSGFASEGRERGGGYGDRDRGRGRDRGRSRERNPVQEARREFKKEARVEGFRRAIEVEQQSGEAYRPIKLDSFEVKPNRDKPAAASKGFAKEAPSAGAGKNPFGKKPPFKGRAFAKSTNKRGDGA